MRPLTRRLRLENLESRRLLAAVNIPDDLIGLPCDEARQLLAEELGLSVTPDAGSDPADAVVVELDPPPGTAVHRGDEIVVDCDADEPSDATGDQGSDGSGGQGGALTSFSAPRGGSGAGWSAGALLAV